MDEPIDCEKNNKYFLSNWKLVLLTLGHISEVVFLNWCRKDQIKSVTFKCLAIKVFDTKNQLGEEKKVSLLLYNLSKEPIYAHSSVQ